jgi:uncharacterized protein (DUF2132 family)
VSTKKKLISMELHSNLGYKILRTLINFNCFSQSSMVSLLSFNKITLILSNQREALFSSMVNL